MGGPGASLVMGNLLTLIFRPLQEGMQISQIDVTIFLMKKKKTKRAQGRETYKTVREKESEPGGEKETVILCYFLRSK